MIQKCIIFDCDGVLVDSEMVTTQHFIQQLHDIGYEISMEAAIRQFTGMSDNIVYQHLRDAIGDKFTPALMTDIITRVYRALHAEVSAIAGISQVLDLIDNVENISRCVASSGTREKIHSSLRVTGLTPYFHQQHIFSIQDVTRGKPAPDLFLFAAEQMQHLPENCIVIEDSTAGIEAARAAHMPVISFLGGSHTHYPWYEEKIQAYHVPIAHNANELMHIIKQQL